MSADRVQAAPKVPKIERESSKSRTARPILQGDPADRRRAADKDPREDDAVVAGEDAVPAELPTRVLALVPTGTAAGGTGGEVWVAAWG